jgi:hypothetical protein
MQRSFCLLPSASMLKAYVCVEANRYELARSKSLTMHRRIPELAGERGKGGKRIPGSVTPIKICKCARVTRPTSRAERIAMIGEKCTARLSSLPDVKLGGVNMGLPVKSDTDGTAEEKKREKRRSLVPARIICKCDRTRFYKFAVARARLVPQQ